MKHLSAVILLFVLSCGLLHSQNRQEVYCFNQRYIVSEGGKFGLVDKQKKEILPVVYDGISFLTDDIALLSRYGSFMLSDKWGRIFAESSSRKELENNCQELYDQVLADDYIYWNDVIEEFYKFADKCWEVKGRLNAESLLLPYRQKIENLLKMKRGRMTEVQLILFKSRTDIDYFLLKQFPPARQ